MPEMPGYGPPPAAATAQAAARQLYRLGCRKALAAAHVSQCAASCGGFRHPIPYSYNSTTMGSAAKCCRRASGISVLLQCYSATPYVPGMSPRKRPAVGEAWRPGRGRSPAGGVAAAAGAGAPPDRSNSSGRGVCSGDRGVSAGVDGASLSGATCTPTHGQRHTAGVHSDEDEHMQASGQQSCHRSAV